MFLKGTALQAAEKILHGTKSRGFVTGHDPPRRIVPQMQQNEYWALQAAEKLNRAVGRGFIPGIKPIESMWALAPEVCFSGLSPEIRPFSAAALPCERNKLGSQVDISGVDAARQSPRAGNRAQRNQ